MRIRSRTTRRLDAFDRKFDASVTPVLAGAGFTEVRPYVFERPDAAGRDRVYFDIEGKSVIVFVSYLPAYMEEIDHLYEHLLVQHQPNMGGSSYLTPKCMIHLPKEFPCKSAAARDHSLALIVEGLRTHALDWLATLRAPTSYALAVPPTAMMYVGRANEVAGRCDVARVAYEEMFRRLLLNWNRVSFDSFVTGESARVFVYLCQKLGREREACVRVMDAMDFFPSVELLRT